MTFAKIGLPKDPQGRIRIKSCQSSSYWYAGLVGQVVPFERVDGYGYWAREGGIYNCINVIKHEDATLLPPETTS